MDLSKLSDGQISALQSADYSKLSDDEVGDPHFLEVAKALDAEKAQNASAKRGPNESVATPWDKLFGTDAINQRLEDNNEKRKAMGLPPNAKQPEWSLSSILAPLLKGNGVDSEAKAMAESMTYPSQKIREGISSLLTKAGAPELKKPTSYVDVFNKQGGLPKAAAYLLGLPADVVLDPLAGFVGAKGTEEPASNSITEALTAKAPEGAANPIGDMIQSAGKKVYRMPFKRADERVLEFRDAATRGPHEFSDYLWNNGNPRVGGWSKTNPEISAQMEAERSGAWRPVQDQLDRNAIKMDIAPGLTEGRNNARQAAMDNYYNDVATKAEDAATKRLEKIDLPDDIREQAIEREVTEAVSQAKENLTPEYEDFLKQQAEDKWVKGTRRRLMRQVAGGPNEAKAAFDEVRQHMPVLSDHIDLIENEFLNGDRKAAEDAMQKLIQDGMRGERSLTEMHDLSKRYGQLAAGSENFKTSGYKFDNKMTGKVAEWMKRRGSLNDIIKAAINVQEGPEGVAKYDLNNQLYGAMARGMKEARKATKQATVSPAASKLDLLMAGLSHGDPTVLGTEAVMKANQLLNYNPRFATGTGMLLNNIGKSSIWDRLLLKKGLENVENDTGVSR